MLALWSENAGHVWILELARLEFTSALLRRYRKQEIDDTCLRFSLQAFDEQLAAFHVAPLSPPLLQEAERLLREYGKSIGLRTLDALHLAGYSLVAEPDWAFATADSIQAEAAKAAGWDVIMP